MKSIILLLLTFSSLSSFAVNYYQFNNGVFISISEADFTQCKEIIFRKEGGEQLSPAMKAKLVGASMKGQVVNDEMAIKARAREKTCSYGDDLK
jgi:hypothetical protein